MWGRLALCACSCLESVARLCASLGSCIWQSPLPSAIALGAVSLVLLAIVTINACLARALTVPVTIVVNLVCFWLLLRLVVRVLVFPGSIVCYKRSTEASYRVEMSRLYTQHLEQLQDFLVQATTAPDRGRGLPGVTMEDVLLGCVVIEGLARNFHVQQQRFQVRFTAEQVEVHGMVQFIKRWLSSAEVRERHTAGSTLPLMEWLRRTSSSHAPAAPFQMLQGVELKAEVAPCIDRIRQLLTILDELQRPEEGMCRSTCRFLRSPTVGSLHQLRAELQVRYEGRQCWVKTPSGHALDAMLISCRARAEGAAHANDDESGESSSGQQKEDAPLKGVSLSDMRDDIGPTIVWCNPNAGFYETMVYDSQWLEFYLSHGCDVFLFNYRGFGRSSGSPSPSALKEDGDSVVDFLRKRGVTEIGVHARSIGGIVGCHIARSNPNEVKLLVADRTFCTLATTAKFTFGNWAVQGLSLAATTAENTDNFLEARCYKVLISDPKDATIPDIASLRTAVALDALDHIAEAEQLRVDEDVLRRVADAWAFLEAMLAACEGGGSGAGSRCACCPDGRNRRPPSVLGASVRDLELAEMGGEAGASLRELPEVITAGWMEDHSDAVRAALVPYVDNIRMAMEAACTSFEAGGMSLDELLSQAPGDPVYALRCFLANVQVWGSVGEHGLTQLIRPSLSAACDAEVFLSKGGHVDFAEDWVVGKPSGATEAATRLQRAAATLTSKQVAAYYRQLARTQISRSRRELRQVLGALVQVLEMPGGVSAASLGGRVLSAIVSHLREIEGLITSISTFFRCVDIAGDAAGPSESGHSQHAAAPPPPPVFRGRGGGEGSAALRGEADEQILAVDHSRLGYLVPVDCGHNGYLDETESRHLSLHIRTAEFGRAARQDPMGPVATAYGAPRHA